MKSKKLIKNARKLARPFRIDKGKKFRLKDFDPGDTLDFTAEDDKERAREALANGIEELAELQTKLYAQDKWAVLIILQAMDAAGKDSAIKHVMSGLNPQGCNVFSFKAPSAEELDHDYLWRCLKVLPRRGEIGIFNRSYYEEVLVVRVHPGYLRSEKVPSELVTKHIWKERFEDIRHLEHYLSRNGVIVRKIFLNVSREEQERRFMDRIDDPSKNWKFSADDVTERDYWDQYMDAYEDMIQHTATSYAPWYIVPADHKWFTRMIVASIVVEALASVKLDYPTMSDAQLEELAVAKKTLESS